MGGEISMTRKHYVLIADAIKSNINGLVCINKETLIEDLIDVFKADNVRFNADKFMAYINGDM